MSRSKHTIAANGHVGRPYADHGAMAFPIFQSSNFKYEDAAPYVATLNGGPETKRFKYSRYTNPTEAEALRILCELEGADGGVLVGSGMAAVSLVYSTFLRPGDHVVISENSYYRSYSVLKRSFERIGVSVSVLTAGADLTDLLTERTTLVHVETPSNYLLRVFDIARIADQCRAHGALLSIDSTLATPINQNPLAHGADLVVHSASKYLGGHNDIVAGVIVGRQELVDRLAQEKGYSGASVDPFASYLLLRGLKTLAVRMAHVNASTLRIAQELRELDGIEWVCHPGLPEHPDHELAGRYLGGGAGILYASLAPGRGSNDQTVVDFLDGLEVCVIASSFGGTESLARPANMEEFPDHPRLIRFAIGLESAEDIVNDVKQSLKRLHA